MSQPPIPGAYHLFVILGWSIVGWVVFLTGTEVLFYGTVTPIDLLLMGTLLGGLFGLFVWMLMRASYNLNDWFFGGRK